MVSSVKFIWILIALSSLTQCNKEDVSTDLPPCLSEIIAQLEKEDCPSVGQVFQYQFQGKTVYVIHPKNCGADLTSGVVDKNCNPICQLGGIAGNANCEGVNFMEHATDEKLVYPLNK